MEKKRLPIGISDFKEIIEENYYFIDKSLLIEELVEKGAKVTLLPRPRRFGKTLNMSMIRYFFDVENKDENRPLFNGLEIEKTKYIKEQGEYPVIYLSFKDVKTNNWEECLEQVKFVISELYKNHKKIKHELERYEQEYFELIESKSASDTDFSNSILQLSKYLKKYYEKGVVILIDEYDTPLTSAYVSGYYNEAISFFRNLLSAAFKDNVALSFGVMTGITRVAKESIFSGLNNLDIDTILDNRYNYFGLKEVEVEKIVKYYGLEYEIDDVKKWYNGYSFGQEKVYNPWSIINFINNKELGSYWINTSDNQLINNILRSNDEKILEDLKSLFSGETIEKKILENIVFDNLNQVDTIWSLFLFSGYITYTRKKVSEITRATTYELTIPNQEIKTFWKIQYKI